MIIFPRSEPCAWADAHYMIIFPRSDGLPPGAWADGHYMIQLREKTQLVKTRHRHLVNGLRGGCGLS